MICDCCGGEMPDRDVWEARRDEADECDGSVDARTGRCRAWVREDLWGTRCQCSACGCDEPAMTTDDDGVPVCDECSCYAVDAEGQVHCSRDGDVIEEVVESCGAGGQTRSYYRMRPPAAPETDADGAWATWWETVGDDSHMVDRYATRADAEQAIAAYDWPGPSDHTPYLCGYGVRTLADGEWIAIDEEAE